MTARARPAVITVTEAAAARVRDIVARADKPAVGVRVAFDAVTGKITINEKRDATKSAVILQVQGGKFKFLETVNP